MFEFHLACLFFTSFTHGVSTGNVRYARSGTAVVAVLGVVLLSVFLRRSFDSSDIHW